MEKASLINRCMWLISTINAHGSITKKQIDDLWSRSCLNTKAERYYNERTLRRHREHCSAIFDIDIDYNFATHTYSIRQDTFHQQSQFHEWLLNSFSVQILLDEVKKMSSRVLLEYIPSGFRFLTTVLTAMSHSQQLEVTYQGFDRAEPHTFMLAPYCVKVFKQRWYVIGQSDIHEELRVYSLDRVHEMKETEEAFVLPVSFDAESFFAPYYGVICGTSTPSTLVRIKVGHHTAKYIRSLPLHHSQAEEVCQSDFSIFTYYLAPTFDFIQELRTQGSDLEVLAPLWLREQFAEEAKKLAKIYRK